MLWMGNDINVVDDRNKNEGILKGGDVLLIKLFDRKEGLVFVVFLNEDVELLNQIDDKVDDLLMLVENLLILRL